MIYLFIVLLLAVAAALTYLALLPAVCKVTESREIQASAKNLYERVRDLKSWPQWSPWLMHEPDTRLTYSSDASSVGSYHTWEGKWVGSGKLIHTDMTNNERIEQRIEFFKPFKSKADIVWQFIDNGDSTRVVWSMESKMPFFMRWMVPIMTAMITSDYRIGLLLLDQELSPQADVFQLDFTGKAERSPLRGIKKSYSGTFAAMPQAMEEGFSAMMKTLEEAQEDPTAPPLTAYHRVNIRKMTTVCDMVVPTTLEDSGEATTIPGGGYLRVIYTGDYKHLGLAWHAAISHQRMRKYRMDKSRPSLEVYMNDPRTTPPNERQTELLVPLR